MGVFQFILKIILWISTNWKTLGIAFLLIFILSLTGSLTMTIKSVKRGIKEMLNPIGIFVFLVISILVLVLLKNLEVMYAFR